MTETDRTMRTPTRIDLVAALFLVTLVAIGTSELDAAPTERAVDGLAYACGVVAAASLVFWRRWTIVVAGIVSVAIGVYLARGYPSGPAFFSVPLAMIAMGYLAPRRVAWMGVGGLLVTTAIGSAIAGAAVVQHALFAAGWGAAAVLAGQALAARDERAQAERDRVAHTHERALAGERLRIAQDVHDSVAHAMATINVQSGVAAHLVEQKPEQAAVALEAIRAASHDALEELGSILGVLRDSDSAAPLEPLAGLGEISALVDRARSDGVHITFQQSGDGGAISPTLGAAAYRVVQEALTNTRRHAGEAAMVTVTVAVGDTGSLRITIRDDGGRERENVDQAARSNGFGLVGMRERIEASGGSLTVGPATPSGFMVDAVWPDRPTR